MRPAAKAPIAGLTLAAAPVKVATAGLVVEATGAGATEEGLAELTGAGAGAGAGTGAGAGAGAGVGAGAGAGAH